MLLAVFVFRKYRASRGIFECRTEYFESFESSPVQEAVSLNRLSVGCEFGELTLEFKRFILHR